MHLNNFKTDVEDQPSLEKGVPHVPGKIHLSQH